MISVPLEITEGATRRTVRITAPTIERALALAGESREGRSVRVLSLLEEPRASEPPGDARERAA